MEKLVGFTVAAVAIAVMSLVTTAMFVLAAHSIWDMYLHGYGGGPSYEQWAGIGFTSNLLLYGLKTVDNKGWMVILAPVLGPLFIWMVAALSHAVLF